MTNGFTEAVLLEHIWGKYGKVRSLGDTPRYLVANHPRTPLGDMQNNRVLDCIVLDRFMTRPDYRKVDFEPYNPVIGIEIKTSRADLLRELKNPEKSEAWKKYCTHFYLLGPVDIFKPDDNIPEDWGIMVPPSGTVRIKKKAIPNPTPEPMTAAIVSAITYAGIKTDRLHRI